MFVRRKLQSMQNLAIGRKVLLNITVLPCSLGGISRQPLLNQEIGLNWLAQAAFDCLV
jgi:hypothetical protein